MRKERVEREKRETGRDTERVREDQRESHIQIKKKMAISPVAMQCR